MRTIDAILKPLSYREREIIKLRYGIGDGYTYTLAEVARIFNVTTGRVRQIEARGLCKICRPFLAAIVKGERDKP